MAVNPDANGFPSPGIEATERLRMPRNNRAMGWYRFSPSLAWATLLHASIHFLSEAFCHFEKADMLYERFRAEMSAIGGVDVQGIRQSWREIVLNLCTSLNISHETLCRPRRPQG